MSARQPASVGDGRVRLLSSATVQPLPPGRRPRQAELQGDVVSLEPIDRVRHARELFRAGHDDAGAWRLWTYLPYGPFESERVFGDWLASCAASADPLFFAVRPRASGEAAGMASFLNIRAADGVLEMGHIWFAPALRRTRAATEALVLMLRHAFDDLGYRRVEWKCDALNEPSRRAALRLGFRFEGIFYRHMIVKGRNRDTAWFSILAEEWPPLRDASAVWMAPDNFDAAGRQRRSLASERFPSLPADLAGRQAGRESGAQNDTQDFSSTRSTDSC